MLFNLDNKVYLHLNYNYHLLKKLSKKILS